MARSDLPRDVDLTIKMDFCVTEPTMRSIKLPKEERDTSYKRYHKYKKPSNETSTSYTGFNDSFTPVPRPRATTTYGTLEDRLSGMFDSLNRMLGRDTVYVEEKVCWRKLFKDPDLYGEASMTVDEAVDHMKNLNFPLGSKEDRAKFKYEMEKQKKEFCGGHYCDCCGTKLNLRNCLSHNGYLCESCNKQMEEAIRVARLH